MLQVKKEIKVIKSFISSSVLLARLFFREVPEIYEGTIEIKSVARDPEAELYLCSLTDSSIDPVGACVGTEVDADDCKRHAVKKLILLNGQKIFRP